MTVFYVQWLDSGMHLDFDRGWREGLDYKQRATLDNMVVHSVGFVLHEDEDVIVLGQSHDPSGDKWVGAQVIAKRNVLSLQKFARAES